MFIPIEAGWETRGKFFGVRSFDEVEEHYVTIFHQSFLLPWSDPACCSHLLCTVRLEAIVEARPLGLQSNQLCKYTLNVFHDEF